MRAVRIQGRHMVPAGWVGRAGQALGRGKSSVQGLDRHLGRRAKRMPVSEWKMAEAGMHKAHTA